MPSFSNHGTRPIIWVEPGPHSDGNALKYIRFNSLRSRYAAVAVVLTLAVLAGSYLGHRNVSEAQKSTTANIETRNQLLQYSRHIRDAVWQAREALAAFLLEPERREYRVGIHDAISNAQSYTTVLENHPWIIAHQQRRTVSELSSALKKLDAGAEQLVATRMVAEKQYPALAFARGSMLPKHRAFYTAASLAMNELMSERPHGVRLQAYQMLVQARHMWDDMISTFRMYLANRLGSFNEAALPHQEQDMSTEYHALVELIGELQALDHDDQLGLQTSESLRHMRVAADGWFEDLKKVERIHHSGQWRADKQQINTVIEPLLERIWNLMLSLDVSIEASSNQDVASLTRVAQSQSRMVWMLTILGLISIAAGFIALERSILRPIATVAEALKEEALGGEGEALPPATSDETRHLLEAFDEMRKQVHNRQLALEHQAMHDALTGLPNRTLLLDRLQQAIYAARRDHGFLSLMMMDLDRFKDINDTLGHQVGDRLLKEMGTRLLATLREMDTVARLGGDEFAVLLPHTDVDQALLIASKTRAALGQVFSIDGHQLYVGASIGIAVYPQHGTTGPALIQRADVAMYVAKRNKMGQSVYDPREDQHSVGRLALMTDLYDALDADALELNYQPKIHVPSGEVIGVEALLRWHHPRLGAIAPDEIIPLAEQTGLIKPLTLWVLTRAIRDCSRWLKAGLDVSVAVNLSVYNLQDTGFVSQVQDRLNHYDLDARHLTLEITESAMMANPAHAVEILTLLDGMGVRLAVDDFGTGFSSLAYLKQLPVDELKIDKSFVLQMTEDENDAVIVRSTIDLAHNLGLRVVAEGVESQDVWDLLEILGCDEAQGHFMSRPLAAAHIEQWLLEQSKAQAG